jgi:sugar lactone lactonase YvrE
LSRWRRFTAAGAGIGAVALCAATLSPAVANSARARGDIKVFAHVGPPGEPSLTLVTPHHTVYVGTFENVAGTDTSPSKVFAYNAAGKLRRTYVIHGQTPGAAHGVQVAARDRDGRLYILDQKPARVITLNPKTGKQRTYARFADVPTCSAAHRTKNCTNSDTDGAPEPDYAAWLPDGSLVVTDYSQQIVWRVPPGGGKARVWMNNKVFDGELFGPAGIVLMPSHRSLLMTVATGGIPTASANDNPAQGRLYRIRLGRHDTVRSLHRLWSSGVGAAPDGFAVSRNRRHVYIAMAGPTANSVVEVAHGGHGWKQVWQVPGPSDPNGIASSPVPWDTATSVQFLGTRILVTNQAYFSGDSSHWVIFDVQAGERGMPVFTPHG